MNQHDPIIGRYVYVTCQGKTYRTYYEETGEGIPMVCLHTAGTDGRQYRHQLCDPDISANFRVIAFDMPWHGKSIPPADFHLMEDEYKLTTSSSPSAGRWISRSRSSWASPWAAISACIWR
jgi:pimeloyl-ACP methyl ester carboxylesterase